MQKMPGGKNNGEKGKSSEWAKQAVLAKEKSVRTLMLFLLPNWKGGDVEKKKADLGSAIRTTINKLVKVSRLYFFSNLGIVYLLV
jgi:hypothetical protein